MADLVTGARGQAHITPKNDAVIHRGMMGVESCILDYGEKLAPALIPSQPTNIRILDGCGMMQGRFFEIEEGSYDTIAIPNGAQGYNRIDIVCAKITQNENGTQTFSWEVVQGTQTAGTPQPPTVEEGSLDDGDEFALMPIASVELEGVTIVAVETVAEIVRLASIRKGEFMEVKELLWTNPNPEASFGGQKVSIDLSNCNYAEIELYKRVDIAGGKPEIKVCRLPIGKTDSYVWVDYSYGGIATLFGRGIITSTDGVEFSDALYKAANSSTEHTLDALIIPQRIYGIKHI